MRYSTINEEQFNSNGKFKIPERFVKALNALHPEIDKLVICEVNRFGQYDPNTFEPIYKFMVSVNVSLKDETEVKGGITKYNDIINETFKLTFVDMDFVMFETRSMTVPKPKLTNQQLFYEFFGDD